MAMGGMSRVCVFQNDTTVCGGTQERVERSSCDADDGGDFAVVFRVEMTKKVLGWFGSTVPETLYRYEDMRLFRTVACPSISVTQYQFKTLTSSVQDVLMVLFSSLFQHNVKFIQCI